MLWPFTSSFHKSPLGYPKKNIILFCIPFLSDVLVAQPFACVRLVGQTICCTVQFELVSLFFSFLFYCRLRSLSFLTPHFFNDSPYPSVYYPYISFSLSLSCITTIFSVFRISICWKTFTQQYPSALYRCSKEN